tara:strand:+ start:388 stop:675 length:288 start_codon:yes stop_codon:yes gene_type:complete
MDSNSNSFFYTSPSTVISDFNFIDPLDNFGKGEFFSETNRAIVYLYSHNQIEDLISTINHELYHSIINMHEIIIDTAQEEKLINKLTWTLEGVLI